MRCLKRYIPNSGQNCTDALLLGERRGGGVSRGHAPTATPTGSGCREELAEVIVGEVVYGPLVRRTGGGPLVIGRGDGIGEQFLDVDWPDRCT